MSLTTVEIQSFSGPSVVDMEGSGEPTIVYINQGPAGTAGPNEIIQGATATALVGFIYGDNGVVNGSVPSQNFRPNNYGELDFKLPQYDGVGSLYVQDRLNFGISGRSGAIVFPTGLSNNSTFNWTFPDATGYVALTTNANGSVTNSEVYVKAGQTISAGNAVYISGASGANKIISLAQANNDLLSSKTLGLSLQNLTTNQFGYVVTEGDITGLSINLGAGHTVVEGDPIWLSPTTPGGLLYGTANKPSAPNHLVFIGVVTRINGNTLTDIFVKVQNGFEIEELHNVAINGKQNGQVLTYESSTQLWKNKANYTAKSTTGNPATGIEGEICINTFDNNVKIYADGGWRQIATW